MLELDWQPYGKNKTVVDKHFTKGIKMIVLNSLFAMEGGAAPIHKILNTIWGSAPL